MQITGSVHDTAQPRGRVLAPDVPKYHMSTVARLTPELALVAACCQAPIVCHWQKSPCTSTGLCTFDNSNTNSFGNGTYAMEPMQHALGGEGSTPWGAGRAAL
jgi:hypothetical protein